MSSQRTRYVTGTLQRCDGKCTWATWYFKIWLVYLSLCWIFWGDFSFDDDNLDLMVIREVVPCPLPQGSKMQLISKDGASQWSFSLQVAGTIHSVVSVEAKVGSAWQHASRTKYNYWEISAGAGEAPDIRVTCSNKAQVITPRVKISSSNVVTGNGNCWRLLFNPRPPMRSHLRLTRSMRQAKLLLQEII